MTDDEIPDYHSRRETCLAPHEEEIMKLRAKRWPYRAIIDRLEERHEIRVAYSTLREFCVRRKITKADPGWEIRKPAEKPEREREKEIPADNIGESAPRKKLTLKVIKSS